MAASRLNSTAVRSANAQTTPYTLSAFSQSSGTNRRAVVFITAEDQDVATTTETVTWGGVSMTRIAQALQGATFNQRVTLFELLEASLPADGNVDVVLSFSEAEAGGTRAYSIEAYLLDGVHQNAVNSAQITTYAAASTTTVVLDNTITSAATHVILACATFNGEGTTLTPPTSFTEMSDGNIGSGAGGRSGSAYYVYTGSSETLNMDYIVSSSSSRVAGVSISYGEFPSGAPTEVVIHSVDQAQSVEASALVQANTLVISDLTQIQTIDGATLVQANIVQIADALQLQTLDETTLLQANTLVIADISQAHSLDAVSLGVLVAIQELSHAQTLDSIALTQANTLIVADLTQSQSLDAFTLMQGNIVQVADLTQAHLLEATRVGNPILAVMDGEIVICTLFNANTIKITSLMTGRVILTSLTTPQITIH